MYGMERKPKRKSQSKLMISYAGAYHMSDLLLVATFLWGLFLNFPNFISFSFFFKNLHHEKKANLDERRGGDSQGWTSNLGPFFFFLFFMFNCFLFREQRAMEGQTQGRMVTYKMRPFIFYFIFTNI